MTNALIFARHLVHLTEVYSFFKQEIRNSCLFFVATYMYYILVGPDKLRLLSKVNKQT